MSRRSYSHHIPDFRFMTFFAESGSSRIHRMSPWTKAALLVVSILFVIILEDVYVLLALYLLVLAFYIAARLPLGVMIGWYSLPVLFVVTIAVLFVFTEPGDSLISFDLLGARVVVSDSGLFLLISLLLRALIVVTFSFAFFMTTRYAHIAYMASRLLPKPLANIFLLSYRFNFETSDELSDVVDAVHARSGNMMRGVSRQTRLFAGIFGLSFVHAFERAERIAKAMEARGFSGEFPTAGRPPSPTHAGYLLIVLAAVALALAAYARYFEDITGWW